jgi:hypothetical protein
MWTIMLLQKMFLEVNYLAKNKTQNNYVLAISNLTLITSTIFLNIIVHLLGFTKTLISEFLAVYKLN